MAKVVMVLICLLALVCAGCVSNNEKGPANDEAPANDEVGQGAKAASNAPGASPLSAKIISPGIGSIFSGDKTASFDASASGGTEPYSYRWSSSIIGPLSESKSFTMKPSQLKAGDHTVILTVTDANGESAQATTNFQVI